MALSEREGVAGIALLAMYADGVIMAEEDEVLRSRLLQYPLFSELDDEELGDVLQRIEKLSRAEGTQRLLASCASSIGPMLRPTAFLIAAEIIVADGEVVVEETDYLHALEKALQLPEGQSRHILDVVAIRGRR